MKKYTTPDGVWVEVDGPTWDRLPDSKREILFLRAEHRIAFVARVQEHK